MCIKVPSKSLKSFNKKKPKITLTLIKSHSGFQAGQQFVIGKYPFWIGRDRSSNDLVLPEISMVRRHCALTWEGECPTLYNVRPGTTRVNGKRIGAEAIELHDSDELQLAENVFLRINFDSDDMKRN